MGTLPVLDHAQTSIQPRWNLATKVLFRFVCIYFLLYCVPGPLQIQHRGETWTAVHVFHLSGPVTVRHMTGSGDTTLDYISNLLIVVFAASVTLVWSFLDRKRLNYVKLHGWLRLLVRYSLSLTLFSYGLVKIFPLQMPFPNLYRLTEQFGDFSPMGVLWTFLGASPAYEMFSGMAEAMGGALLLFRRTTTLGALVSAGVLLNVVMLNFTYDVPVKLYSSNLLLMALFLAAPDLGKLFNFLVLNRPATRTTTLGPALRTRRERIGATVLQAVVVGMFLFRSVTQDYNQYKALPANPRPARPAPYGQYDVESFTLNGQETPGSAERRWQSVEIQQDQFRVRMMDGSRHAFQAESGGSAESVRLSENAHPDQAYKLTFSRPDGEHLVMEGTLNDDSLAVKMRTLDASKFPLLHRGFHWIQENPYNR
jgi:hypothetical protein